MARLFNSIPVERPQDLAKPGPGTIYMDPKDPLIIHGQGTRFTQLKDRSMLSLAKGGAAPVLKVISDTELKLKKPWEEEAAITLLTLVGADGKRGTPYKVIPHVDQAKMFQEVTCRLHLGQGVGIFPEGGSHDRPELLPLKPGVAMMALEAMSLNPDCNLSIVPVGLNYYHADRFRSRAVIEYGDPISVPFELVAQYARGDTDKRKAVSLLLDTIQVSLKQLTLQAPDFETLMVVQAARRLYSADRKLDIDSSLRLSRRFAFAFDTLRDRPEIHALVEEVKHYNRMLKYYGVRDHQVKNTSIPPSKAIGLLFYRSFQLLFITLLAAPMLILGSPLLYIAVTVAKSKMHGLII